MKYNCISITFLLVIISHKVIGCLTKWIPNGQSISLECDFKPEDTGKPVWRFNGKTIFADSVDAYELGISNVHGEFINNSHTFLNIQHVQAENEGNYICLFNGTVQVGYTLHVIDPIHVKLWVNNNNNSKHQQRHKGEKLILTCLAFNVTGNTSVYWTIQSAVDTNVTKETARRFQNKTVKAQLSLVLVENINVTCHVTLDKFEDVEEDVTISVSLKPVNSFSEETKYIWIFVLAGITITVICLVVCFIGYWRRKGNSSNHTYSSVKLWRY
uniref:Neuropeptide 20 n=1 Tax=Stichopus japonicus TaxID=307972 RepID=A0A346TLN6_STIJA|nr:Neuropeptide precursor 20 [Apostichopus japonicus]